MAENRFWEAFKVQDPNAGAKEQPAAEAVPPTATEGERESGSNAGPDNTGAEGSSAPEAPGQQGQTQDQPEQGQPQQGNPDEQAGQEPGQNPAEEAPKEKKPEQSEEERRANAAQRRAREEQALIQKTTERVTQELLQKLSIKDPNNDNRTVSNMEELEAYLSSRTMSRINREAREGRLTQESFEAALMQSPKLRQLVEGAENARKQAQDAQKKAQAAQYNANMARQIAEIQKMNPGIKSIDDVIRMETGPKFAEFVAKGLEPVDAYRLANHDAIVSRARSAAEQAARNAAAGKGHMQPVGTTGKSQETVSSELRGKYRKFNPNITDAEILKIEARLNNT